MQSFNHVAGGFALTGIFASFADVNIYEHFDTMAVVWIAAILPDIDHTRSLIGKAAYPLAQWLSRHYGHRTITHSIFFYLAVVVLIKGIDNLFHVHYALPVALALGSHLIFDMCTRQGIPLFYPFSKRPAVLPANPKLRLSVNDYRSEVIVFLLFCCLNLFAYPLMASGFWTKYNRSFMTFDHLEREQKHKPGDYRVTVAIGGDTVRGLLYEHTGTKLILYANQQFQPYEMAQCKLLDFRRIPTRHELKAIQLFNVTVDSLNTYLTQPLVKITAQSEKELYYYDHSIMKKGTEISMDFPNQQRFYQLASDNARIKLQLELLAWEFDAEQQEYHAKVLEGAELRQKLRREQTRASTSDYDEGKRRNAVEELTKKLEAFQLPQPPNAGKYRTERALLQRQLKENDRLNANLLIWQAERARN